MSTIVTKLIEGHGPYAYRVEWLPEEETHSWTYLGRVGQVDPDEITDEEAQELREQDFALARFRDGATGELYSLPVANELRDELVERIGDDVLSIDDDRRTTEVQLAEDAPMEAERVLEGRAEEMRAEHEGAGQAALTDAERDRIDFTETSIPQARSAKAAILDEGVDDWQSVWSEDLKTTGEARQAARDNRESISGDRLDNDAGSQTATSRAEAASQQEEQALKFAQEGDEEAREFLEEQGWTADEIANTTPQVTA